MHLGFGTFAEIGTHVAESDDCGQTSKLFAFSGRLLTDLGSFKLQAAGAHGFFDLRFDTPPLTGPARRVLKPLSTNQNPPFIRRAYAELSNWVRTRGGGVQGGGAILVPKSCTNGLFDVRCKTQYVFQ